MRYPELYPELFAELDAWTTRKVLQSIGTNRDGTLLPRLEVVDIISHATGEITFQQLRERRLTRNTHENTDPVIF